VGKHPRAHDVADSVAALQRFLNGQEQTPSDLFHENVIWFGTEYRRDDLVAKLTKQRGVGFWVVHDICEVPDGQEPGRILAMCHGRLQFQGKPQTARGRLVSVNTTYIWNEESMELMVVKNEETNWSLGFER
jgi:hypothetical protein